jgi:hypothetical protein
VYSFLIGGVFSVFFVFAAIFLHPAERPTLHKALENYRTTRRERYYPLVQDILKSLADQQLVIGIAVLSAGIYSRNDTTYYHLLLITCISTVSYICFINSIEFENRPLEKPKLGSGKVPEEELNKLRIVATAVYLILDTYFNASLYSRCKIWDPYVPMNCHQKLVDYYTCWPNIVLGVFWPWVDYIYALYRRSEWVRRQFSSFRCLPASISKVLSVGAARYKSFRWLPSLRTVYFISLASGFVVNFYDTLDLKISTRPIISRLPVMQESEESEWGFGQIVPMVMLLLLPISVARISNRFACPFRFCLDLEINVAFFSYKSTASAPTVNLSLVSV